MSLKRRLEGEVEIHSGAADLYHDMFRSKPHHVATISPHFVQSCDLHHGNLGTPGSILFWKYTIGGKSYVTKNVIETIDDDKKLVIQKAIEGDLLKEYKSIVGICQVIPKDKDTSIVKWAFEYEKLHPGIPEPSGVLDALLDCANDTHDHHQRQHGHKK